MTRKLTILVSLFAALMPFLQVSGQVWVSGTVYEQDSITPVVGASVLFSGVDTDGDTLAYQFFTDSLGYYEDSIHFGSYQISACAEGYERSFWLDSLLIASCDSVPIEYDSLVVVYDSVTCVYDSIYLVYDALTEQYDTVWANPYAIVNGIDLVLYEIRYPVGYVVAQPYNSDFVRVSWSMLDTLTDEDSTRLQRSFRYYELFRRRKDEDALLLASHLTDTVFIETNWNNLPWGQYAWGVSCHYEGNRYASDTVWSAFLDKDMTTTLEVNLTTDVGLPAFGAVVSLFSADEQGFAYQAVADAEGQALMTDVYRGFYMLQVHFDGFVDYVSEDTLSLIEPQHVDVTLREAIYGIDSLYVSHTGYAIWQLVDALNRDLQYFEVKLDGQLIGTTTQTTFQFDINDLLPDQICIAEVRPVYLSDTCAWRSAEWTFRPCFDFDGTEGTLQWSIDNDAVLLSWEQPDEVLGSILYRNGEYLGFIVGSSYLDETITMHGEVEYCISMVYGGPTDGTYYSMSCEECIVVSFPMYCNPPVNLEGENYWRSDSDYGALISWGERPDPVNQWLHYDNGIYKQSLGGDDEPIIFWSVRFEAADLEAYVGTTLTKISLFDVGAGVYQFWVYVGGETTPRTLVWSQNMTLHNANAWHEEALLTDIEIPVNEPIWIVVGQQGLSRPAAACADMGNPNGRWVSLDGEHWMDLSDFNMHYTWMLRAYVSNRLGRSMELGRESLALQHYNLYRSYDNIDYQQIATIPVVEDHAFYRYRDVLVGNEHGAYYYRLSAVYVTEEGEACESDFAASLHHPENQFIYVDDYWSVDESEGQALNLYPNPASDVIHVEMAGMQHVAVFNAFGQILLEQEADGNTLLDLTRLPKGLFWVRVTTQNGTIVKPFVLSR